MLPTFKPIHWLYFAVFGHRQASHPNPASLQDADDSLDLLPKCMCKVQATSNGANRHTTNANEQTLNGATTPRHELTSAERRNSLLACHRTHLNGRHSCTLSCVCRQHYSIHNLTLKVSFDVYYLEVVSLGDVSLTSLPACSHGLPGFRYRGLLLRTMLVVCLSHTRCSQNLATTAWK